MYPGCVNDLITMVHGSDTGRGNLLGIQPWMEPADYGSEHRFRGKIDGYLARAQGLGWMSARTIAVLPEHIGTWLVALDAPGDAVAARTIDAAMLRLVGRRPLGFGLAAVRGWRAWRRDGASSAGRSGSGAPVRFDVRTDAVLRMHAPRMARAFDRVLGGLARRHGITLVAGSLVLPSPAVVDGRLVPGAGPLHNVAVVYGPDGRAHGQLVRKLRPITREQPFTAPGALADLPVFDTPAGRLGVLVCADSWYPDAYAALRARGVELLAVPSYLTPAGVWDAPWQGYDGAPAPDDVAPGDAGVLREHQAWRRYALAGRIGAAGARCGINVFLRGALWDLGADGASLAVCDGAVAQVPHGARGALLNLWLP